MTEKRKKEIFGVRVKTLTQLKLEISKKKGVREELNLIY